MKTLEAIVVLALCLAMAWALGYEMRKPRPAAPVGQACTTRGATMGSYEVNPDVPGRVRASLWLPPGWKPGGMLEVDTRNARREGP